MLPVLEALLALGLTQADIARALRVRRSTVGNWVHGRLAIGPLLLADLRDLLDVARERVLAGWSVHEAIEGWAPATAYERPARPTKNPQAPVWMRTDSPLAARAHAAMQRGDVEELSRLNLSQITEDLAVHLETVLDGRPLSAAWIHQLRQFGLQLTAIAETLQAKRTGD